MQKMILNLKTIDTVWKGWIATAEGQSVHNLQVYQRCTESKMPSTSSTAVIKMWSSGRGLVLAAFVIMANNTNLKFKNM